MTGKKNVAQPRFFKRLREKLYPRNFAAINCTRSGCQPPTWQEIQAN
jgi:hypothetical protein